MRRAPSSVSSVSIRKSSSLSADASTTRPSEKRRRMPRISRPPSIAGNSVNAIVPSADVSTGQTKNSPPGMLPVPASTSRAPTGHGQPQICFVADDPDFLRLVEQLRMTRDSLVHALPVDQARAVEEVGERRQRHSGVLGQRRRRIPAHHRGSVHVSGVTWRRDTPSLESARSLGRDVRAVTCVFRGLHAEPRITLLPRVYLDHCRLGDHLERCMPQPCSVFSPVPPPKVRRRSG